MSEALDVRAQQGEGTSESGRRWLTEGRLCPAAVVPFGGLVRRARRRGRGVYVVFLVSFSVSVSVLLLVMVV